MFEVGGGDSFVLQRRERYPAEGLTGNDSLMSFMTLEIPFYRTRWGA